MVIARTQTDTSFTPTGGGTGISLAPTNSGREFSDAGTAGTGTAEATVTAGGGTEVAFEFLTPASEPGETTWPAGDWVVRLSISGGSTRVDWKATYIVEDVGGTYTTVASLTGQTLSLGGASQTMTVPQGSDYLASASGRIRVVVVFQSNSSHGGQSVQITPDQDIDTPFTSAVQASVAWTGSGSFAAAAGVERQGSLALTGGASFSATAYEPPAVSNLDLGAEQTSGLDLGAQEAEVVAGAVQASWSASASATIAAAPGVTRPGSLAVAGAGSFAAASSARRSGALAVNASGSLAAAPATTKSASLSLSGGASFAASADRSRGASLALTADGDLAAAADRIRGASLAVSGGATFAATPSGGAVVQASWAATGSGSLSANASITAAGSFAGSASGSLAAASSATKAGALAVSGSAALVQTSAATRGASLSLAAGATFAATATPDSSSDATGLDIGAAQTAGLDLGAKEVAAAAGAVQVAVAFSASGSFSATASDPVKQASIALAGSGSLSAAASAVRRAVAAFTAGASFSATPSGSMEIVVHNGATGVAPHQVYFTLSPEPTWQEIQDNDYEWDFDDSGAIITDAIAAEAAHVFEPVDTYTVTCTRRSKATNAVTATASTTITTTSEDAAYPGTQTLCVSTSGTFTGAPAGCATLTTSDPCHATIDSAFGAGKRILFRAGETWTATASSGLSLGDCTDSRVGAFALSGTQDTRGIWSDRPVINCESLGEDTLWSGAYGDDLQLRDIEFIGDDTATSQYVAQYSSSQTTDGLLWLRVKTSAFRVPFSPGVDDSSYGNKKHIFLAFCQIEDALINCMYGAGYHSAIIGTLGQRAQSHVFRIKHWQHFCIDSSEINFADVDGAFGGRHCLKLPSDGTSADAQSRRMFITRNETQHQNGWAYSIGPQNTSSAENCNEVVIAYNKFRPGAVGLMLQIADTRNVEVYNNQMIPYAVGGSLSMLYVHQRGTGQSPGGVRCYHNTVYSAQVHTSSLSVYNDVGGDLNDNTLLDNNLIWAPNATGTVAYSSGTDVTKTNNFDDGVHTTNPLFTSLTAGSEDLSLQATSPCRAGVNTGTRAARDFLGNWRPTSNWDYGAYEESPVSLSGTVNASWSASGSASMAAAPAATLAGSVALTGSASLAASAGAVRRARWSASAGANFSATATAAGTVNASLALSGSASLAASARSTQAGSLALQGSATFAPTAGKVVQASMSLSASASMAWTAGKRLSGAAAFTASGSLASTAKRIRGGSLAVTGSGSASLTAARRVGVSASLFGFGSLGLSARRTVAGSWATSGTCVFSATGQIEGENALGVYERMSNRVRKHFKANVAEALPIDTAYDNMPFTIPTGTRWCSFSVRHKETEPLAKGGRQGSYRMRVEARMRIYVPVEEGRKPGLEVADAFVSAFRGVWSSDVRYLTPRRVGGAARQGAWWVMTYACECYSDFTETKPLGTPLTVQLDRETASNALVSRFVSEIATPESVDVIYDNMGLEGAPSTSPWIRLSVEDGAGSRVDSGEAYRTSGLMIAQVFVPIETGTQDQIRLIDKITAAFRAVNVDGVACGVPTVRTVSSGESRDGGRSGAWWQANVICPFRFVEVVSV